MITKLSTLPPLSTETPQVVVAGQLEPAYEVGGDLFDYAVNEDVVHLAVLDAMGRWGVKHTRHS